ncbi:Dps family protein [Aquabacter spiritensis]|uniref:Starvation-inducible DNA-binding protein n=1 Tax=Aquabacter spiritensis TaxID=933073 RepID=A0A4R3M3F3_9HYPH|nr:DNA starvation/stationary phase protection protein [Aquabacter spiritensis]TCT07720.1 starvation-inducible DNA-binding protein [Aquabacter spiritensis]
MATKSPRTPARAKPAKAPMPEAAADQVPAATDPAPAETAAPPARAAARSRRTAALATPSDFDTNQVKDIAGAMTALLADVFALYLKTKNFHWHVSGPHFRDYHLMLDEQADQIFAMTDDIAERVRKIGGTTLRSIGHAARLQRLKDNDADFVTPQDMLAELREDNLQLVGILKEVHGLADEAEDIATASLIENWVDETERRVWFLFETARQGG